jgi:hypothetical protein
VSVLEDTNVNSNATVRILWFLGFFFASTAKGAYHSPVRSFLRQTSCDLTGDFTVRADWNVCELGERQYGLTIPLVELEARLNVGETPKLQRWLPVETSDAIAVLFEL